MPIATAAGFYVSLRLPPELHDAIEKKRAELAAQTGLSISFADACRATLAKAVGLETPPRQSTKRTGILRRKESR